MRQNQPAENHPISNESFFDDCLEWTHWLVQKALDNSEMVMAFVVLGASVLGGAALISNAPVAEARNREALREYDEAYCYSDGYCHLRHTKVFREGNQIVEEYQNDLRVHNRGNPEFHLDPRFEGRNPVFHHDPQADNPINLLGDVNFIVDHPHPNHPMHVNNQGLFRNAPLGYRREHNPEQNLNAGQPFQRREQRF